MPGGSSDVPFPVLIDAVSTVSATYGVAFQEHLWNGWTSRQSLFVIDRDGVVRLSWEKSDGPADLLRMVQDLNQKRTLIESLAKRSPALREAAGHLLKPAEGHLQAVIAALVQGLEDENPE